jgi:hypothetical protein
MNILEEKDFRFYLAIMALAIFVWGCIQYSTSVQAETTKDATMGHITTYLENGARLVDCDIISLKAYPGLLVYKIQCKGDEYFTTVPVGRSIVIGAHIVD